LLLESFFLFLVEEAFIIVFVFDFLDFFALQLFDLLLPSGNVTILNIIHKWRKMRRRRDTGLISSCG
jgi:hypothetical protein